MAEVETASPGIRRLSVTHFLLALIVFLGVAPFTDDLQFGVLVDSVLLTIVLLFAVAAVGGTRRTLVIAVILVTPALAGQWLHHLKPGLIPRDFTIVAAIVFVAFVTVHLFRYIIRAPQVTDEILHAALAAYLMLGLLWTFAYMQLSRLQPGAFVFGTPPTPPRSLASFEAMFLSFGTLSNVGYDDVRSASRAARMLQMAEGMTGIFYVAIVISRLVALYVGHEQNDAKESPDRR